MCKKKKFLEIFKQLIKYDTPTICNALELLDPKCRNHGYTKKEFFCLNKNLSPIIGFVRTAKIFSNDKNKKMNLKEKKAYYKYMGNEKMPKICIVEDSNINPVGCFWGEVQTNIHKKLGFKGVVTNGSIRDLDDAANNFQILFRSVLPSHACLQLKSIGKAIKIFGVQFKHNDIVHADQHGAVKIPLKYLEKLPEAIKQVIKNEKPILDLCKDQKFSLKKLEDIIS